MAGMNSSASFSAVERLIPYMKKNGGVLTAEQGTVGSIVKFYFGNAVNSDTSLAKHFLTGSNKKTSDFLFISVWDLYRKTDQHKIYLDRVAGLKPIVEVSHQYLHGFPQALDNKYIPVCRQNVSD